jgi:molybdenum cofactor cytidylyltransferase
VRSATVARVADECARRQTVVVPTFERERGHPIGIPAAIGRRLAAANPSRSLKEALAAIGEIRAEFAVDDPGVLRDVDVPADLQTAAAAGCDSRAAAE